MHRYLLPCFIIAVLPVSFYSGWHLREIKAQRDQANIIADYAQQQAVAQTRARQREQQLANQFQTVQENAQREFKTLLDNERTAADHRVQQLVKTYAAGHGTAASSPVTNNCQAERHRATVLAELLTELDELAEYFAVTADRNRLAGLICEKAYDQARKHTTTVSK